MGDEKADPNPTLNSEPFVYRFNTAEKPAYLLNLKGFSPAPDSQPPPLPPTSATPSSPKSTPFTPFSRPNCQRKSDSHATGCLTEVENPRYERSGGRNSWESPSATVSATASLTSSMTLLPMAGRFSSRESSPRRRRVDVIARRGTPGAPDAWPTSARWWTGRCVGAREAIPGKNEWRRSRNTTGSLPGGFGKVASDGTGRNCLSVPPNAGWVGDKGK